MSAGVWQPEALVASNPPKPCPQSPFPQLPHLLLLLNPKSVLLRTDFGGTVLDTALFVRERSSTRHSWSIFIPWMAWSAPKAHCILRDLLLYNALKYRKKIRQFYEFPGPSVTKGVNNPRLVRNGKMVEAWSIDVDDGIKLLQKKQCWQNGSTVAAGSAPIFNKHSVLKSIDPGPNDSNTYYSALFLCFRERNYKPRGFRDHCTTSSISQTIPYFSCLLHLTSANTLSFIGLFIIAYSQLPRSLTIF